MAKYSIKRFSVNGEQNQLTSVVALNIMFQNHAWTRAHAYYQHMFLHMYILHQTVHLNMLFIVETTFIRVSGIPTSHVQTT